MVEPNEARSAVLGPMGRPDAGGPARNLFSTPIVVVQTATATGYGLWIVLGAALALGLYADGRGEVLAPLAIGLVLTGSGLLATCLRLPFARDWHGWNPAQRMMPTLEGMIAMMSFLPMLALAGLARGENDFWATRVAGGALAAGSLATLVYTARAAARELPPAVATIANVWPLGRTVSALFSGGLWFWACVASQAETPAHPADPWQFALLAVALALGLVEGVRWRALGQVAEEHGSGAEIATGRGAMGLLGWRVAVAILSVGLPSMLLLSHPAGQAHALAAGLGALSCVIGQCLEQRLFGRAYVRLLSGRR
ncbi:MULTISPECIES: hypothetical protein [unclassified Luteibacter]|uniref:hypothetical protein n=1 Tax=unclassified Luteibacter TaxID=2620188 RepID=UPI0008D61CDB|nr:MULTISPECIES: hypothetical protein [unclassified Luteibacter]SEO36231.1 hypothetical protein SAMN02800692_0424 [Luteibacter sp. UNC138MFCol5.1]SEW23470.1 hypothetical protein SAMN04515660_3196 [Luteibacter sp. 329MFSha]